MIHHSYVTVLPTEDGDNNMQWAHSDFSCNHWQCGWYSVIKLFFLFCLFGGNSADGPWNSESSLTEKPFWFVTNLLAHCQWLQWIWMSGDLWSLEMIGWNIKHSSLFEMEAKVFALHLIVAKIGCMLFGRVWCHNKNLKFSKCLLPSLWFFCVGQGRVPLWLIYIGSLGQCARKTHFPKDGESIYRYACHNVLWQHASCWLPLAVWEIVLWDSNSAEGNS